jgi:hypothetical protein
LTYDEAIKIMQEARVHMPALAKIEGMYYAISRGAVIGSGTSYPAALRNAKLLPQSPVRKREEFMVYGNDECEVRKGENVVATARSRNYAHRIANALNAYVPNKEGY